MAGRLTASKGPAGLGLGTSPLRAEAVPGTAGIPKGTPGFGPYRPQMPRLGFVVLYRLDGAMFLETRMGDTPPKLTAGYGGWQETPRAKRVALTDWQGSSPFRLEVSLVLGGHRYSQSVEPGVRLLERMATRQGRPEPPLVGVLGPGIPTTAAKIREWVIESLEPGDATYRPDGARTTAAFGVVLMQYVDPEQITLGKAPKRPRPVNCATAKAPANEKHYIARRGDTLAKISARYLGSARCWKRIRRLNERTGKFETIRDPKSLKPGDRLRFP